MKKNTIITISRQYGSGGKEVAELLAKRMNVRCYDRQILYLAAEKLYSSDMDMESILDMSYKMPQSNSDSFMDGLNSIGFASIPPYNQMYREQAKVILEIAQKEGGVFLGRCADAIVRDLPENYRFFIYADDTFRKTRAQEFYGNQSLRELEKEDKTREQYYNYYTGQKWGDPLNYDLMLNTSILSLSKAADLLWDYIEARQAQTIE